jgi:hypothetical protein
VVDAVHQDASSPEQAALDQQIAETRAALAGAPVGTGARPAHEQKLETLYRQRYPEPGVTPTPSTPTIARVVVPASRNASPSLDTLDQAIEGNRAERANAPAGWGLREDLDQERLALFRARYGEDEGEAADEPAPAEPTEKTDPATLQLPPLAGDRTWNRDAVANAYDEAAREGIPPHEVSAFIRTLAEATKEATSWTRPMLETHMTEKHGRGTWDGPAGIDIRAGEVFFALPPGLRAELTATRLVYHPRIAEALAGLHGRVFNPQTPRGRARLRERYE